MRPLLWGLLLAALAGVAAAAVYQWLQQAAAAERERAAALPVLGRVPDFSLVERDGRAVRLADLAGAPWIADFVFTRCVSSCPMLSARMARLDRELPAGLGIRPDIRSDIRPGIRPNIRPDIRPSIRLVSFSVDPAWDTPPVLARYARSFGASRRWLFLTGGEEQMRRLSRQGFKLALEPGGGAAPEAVLHSTRFALVDAAGAIRGYYEALDPQALRRLAANARALARQLATR